MRPLMHRFGTAFAVAVLSLSAATVSAQDARLRARDLGIALFEAVRQRQP